MSVYKSIFVSDEFEGLEAGTQVQGIDGSVRVFGESAFSSLEQAVSFAGGKELSATDHRDAVKLIVLFFFNTNTALQSSPRKETLFSLTQSIISIFILTSIQKAVIENQYILGSLLVVRDIEMT